MMQLKEHETEVLVLQMEFDEVTSTQTDPIAVENYFVDILKHYNSDFVLCDICARCVKCEGKKCESYCEGNEAISGETGETIPWHWTCEDLDYGDCMAREKFCYKCIDLDYKNFEWCGIKEIKHDK